MWTWHQAEGTLSRADEGVARGYSGQGAGCNDPASQTVQGIGPIPQGMWVITGRHDSAETGPCTLTLMPEKGTATFGRSQFRIHGDSIVRPGAASRGCIILPRAIRTAIWLSGDRHLAIVA